jgi:hypothetical protein
LGVVTFAVLLVALSFGGSGNASAQAAGPPDMTQFGYPQVVGSVDYSPGTTQTIAAGTQQVVLPADFISKTVKFELLQGDPASFTASLPVTDQGRTIIVAWAFRVTDTSNNQLVARFDKPVQWSVTDPRIAEGSAVYNTSAANPPVVTANSAPGVITGTTLSHPFGGAGVGWLVLGPPGAAQATATVGVSETATAPATAETTATTVATAVATAAPTQEPTQVATAVPTSAPIEVPTLAPTAVTGPPPGMPRTGGPQDGPVLLALLTMLAMAGTIAGVALRRKRLS